MRTLILRRLTAPALTAAFVGAALTTFGQSASAQFFWPGNAPTSPPANAPALAGPAVSASTANPAAGQANAAGAGGTAQTATAAKIPIPVPNPRRKVQVAAVEPTPPASGVFGAMFGGGTPTQRGALPVSPAPTPPVANAGPNLGVPVRIIAPPARYSPNMFVPQAQFTAAELATLKRISALFNSVKTMQGQFIQVGPRGEEADGKFFLSRPGRIRFQYDPPAKLNVVADGTSILVEDGNSRTHNVYPLSRTPLKHLLSDRIDLTSPQVVAQMREVEDTIAITISEQSFNDGVLTLFFDKATGDLRQWVVTDAQGLDTSVAIYNVATDKPVADQMFRIAAQ